MTVCCSASMQQVLEALNDFAAQVQQANQQLVRGLVLAMPRDSLHSARATALCIAPTVPAPECHRLSPATLI